MTRSADRLEQLNLELHQLDREIRDRLTSVRSRSETEMQSFLESFDSPVKDLANISSIIADHLAMLQSELETARSNI
jgi:hypothetical protein